MPTAADAKYMELRHQSVIKANELIQRSRFNLSLQQQKVILYLISRIRPQDEEFTLYEFDIAEFCAVCGIDDASGKNYKDLKDAIKAIADQSIWVRLPSGKETLVRWIEKPYINEGSGVIQIKLDNDMKPYLLKLKENFTQYELIWTLHFKSKYSIRLYEFCKSIHYHDLEPYEHEYSLDELRRVLGAENYTRYQHFKERALNVAVAEINAYSDKIVTYKPVKENKKFVGILLNVRSKPSLEVVRIESEIDREMGIAPGQMTLWDEIRGTDGGAGPGGRQNDTREAARTKLT